MSDETKITLTLSALHTNSLSHLLYVLRLIKDGEQQLQVQDFVYTPRQSIGEAQTAIEAIYSELDRRRASFGTLERVK